MILPYGVTILLVLLAGLPRVTISVWNTFSGILSTVVLQICCLSWYFQALTLWYSTIMSVLLGCQRATMFLFNTFYSLTCNVHCALHVILPAIRSLERRARSPFARYSEGRGISFTVCFLFAFLSMISRQPPADSSQILHAGVLWFPMCLLPFWVLAAPGGWKKGEMKFSLL